jgi:hypothetical protein
MESPIVNGFALDAAASMIVVRSSSDILGSSSSFASSSSLDCFFFFFFFCLPPSNLAIAAPFAISTGSKIVFRTETTEERTQSIPTRDVSVVGAVDVDMCIDVVAVMGYKLNGRNGLQSC